MAERSFRSPGFFEQEIELVPGQSSPQGIPAGVIGASERGPAFIPTTVGSFEDFQSRFGDAKQQFPSTFAVREWLVNKPSLTFTRVLGAGSNQTMADVAVTLTDGTVKNAGFKLTPAFDSGVGASKGGVQFLTALHFVSSSGGPREEQGLPLFTDNPSFDSTTNNAHLVRAAIFTTKDSRIQVLSHDGTWTQTSNDIANMTEATEMSRKFKLVVSSSDSQFVSRFSSDGNSGVRILTASLDPRDDSYVGKILNTDPNRFATEQHLLYLDFPVDQEVAPVQPVSNAVAVLSGSGAFNTKFGRFDTRYTTPRTTWFISQPYGKKEFDLFYFETISDGAWANDKIKISISNIVASNDKSNPFGTFDVIVRSFMDDDIDPQIIETFSNLSLDSKAENYIGKVIGDKKVYYNFDTDEQDEKRLIISGKYPNRSTRIRVVLNPQIENNEIPKNALPFGFRGVPVLKTTDSLKDGAGSLTFDDKIFAEGFRLTGRGVTTSLTGSLVPPLPFRFKVTKGALNETSGENIGQPAANERTDSRLFWGVFGTSVPSTGSVPNAILNANSGKLPNPLISSYAKFQGIAKQDTLVTGSASDVINANKFTLARVAFANGTISNITGTAEEHVRGAAYVRNGVSTDDDYRINYGSNLRVTLASLINSNTILFNRFSQYAKFTNIFYGGFDGLNILDKDNSLMNDRSTSVETSANGNGKANGDAESGFASNNSGAGLENNLISSYRSAVDLMTDSFSSNVNVLAIPGIREPLITNYAGDKTREYSLALYIRDIPSYDDDGQRLWDDSTKRPSVRQTGETFTGLNIDNNYVAAYYPDVFVKSSQGTKNVKVPPSVAALGAISFNDRVSYPWFAPAGFNRAALDFVEKVSIRLNTSDRDELYDYRVNPIASFPRDGVVIFGQKNLQLAKSALDRVNVRRLVIEIKRTISGIANRMLFEQNNATTRAKFVAAAIPQLALIQSQQGIEKFNVIMDETNNTQLDAEMNKVNGRIVIVPTRTVEFIAIDFAITSSGISFE